MGIAPNESISFEKLNVNIHGVKQILNLRSCTNILVFEVQFKCRVFGINYLTNTLQELFFKKNTNLFN